MWPSDADLIIVLVGLVSYVASIFQGVFTFGDAIFFHVVWHTLSLLAPDFLSHTPYGSEYLLGATMMLSVRSGINQPYFCYKSWKYRCPKLLWVSIPTTTVCALLGTYVLYETQATGTWLHYFLGFSYGSMALAFAVLTTKRAMRNEAAGVVKMSLQNDDEWNVTKPQLFMFGVSCCLGGFLSGLVNVGGPPMMLMALYLDLPHRVIRGTTPFVFCTSLTTRFLVLLFAGAYKPEAWMLYAAILLGSFAGLLVGVELAGVLTHDTVAFSCCWIIFFAAVGTAGVSFAWTVASVVFCGLSFLAFHRVRAVHRQRRLTELQQEPEPPLADDDDASPTVVTVLTPTPSPPSSPTSDEPSPFSDVKGR